jgi:molybdenum cofactor cytidylyltransferase
MNLTRALDLHGGESVAFVGAGGKTNTIFRLANSLDSPVMITTTTHLGAWQAARADQHIMLAAGRKFPHLDILGKQVTLFTGPSGKDDRLSALDRQQLVALHDYCRGEDIPLLIEADGAKLRPLKAPAPYEPVIPNWVDKVVVVAGLRGLGESLSDEFVHRPQRFSELSGLPLGEQIRVEELAVVLRSKEGGLKEVPKNALAFVFLNQAENPQLQGQANRLAQTLVDCFDRVLIGSTQQSHPDEVIQSVHCRMAGIVLAAGGSERLGRPKQLLSWERQLFVSVVVKTALEAGLAPLVVVTGSDHKAVSLALQDFPVKIIYNPDWHSGQASSMQAGLRALPERCEGCVFLLSDQPQVSARLLRQLLERYMQSLSPIVAPLVAGQRGNPVLFSKETFTALDAVEGDLGGRAIFRQFKVDWVPWVDDRMAMDVDRMEDYQTLNAAFFP